MSYIGDLKKRIFPRTGTVEVLNGDPRITPWKAYAGDFPNPLKSTKTDPNGDDNILLPLIAQIVDTSVAALLGDGIKIDVQGENEEAAQAYLDAFFARSRLNTTVKKAALNGAVQGHSFVKLIIGADGKPERFQCLLSQTVAVDTDPRDCERAVRYIVSWKETNPQTKKEELHQEITERTESGEAWTITEYVQSGRGGNWQMVGEPTDWPFPYAPIFDCQNLTNPLGYIGRPDATAAVIAQNQSINCVLSLCARLLRTHASPKTILTGIKASKAPEFVLDGAIQLPEGATANQLELNAQGAGALIELYKVLREALHSTSRTPEVASGKLDNVGAISGTALQILFRPLTEKTAEKRLHLGEMMEELLLHVLELGGFAGRTVKVVWPDTTPKSDKEEREVAQIDQQLGVASKETLAKKLGYDWETEKEQLENEGADAGGSILDAMNKSDNKGNPLDDKSDTQDGE